MPAPSWQDEKKWRDLLCGDGCPLCNRGAGPGVAGELRTCFALVDANVNVRGYCCLVLKEHATELHQLSTATATAFIQDVQDAALAVQKITGCIKINYEIHGNVIPHIHMHLVPRYPGDAVETGGITWHNVAESPYGPGEFEVFAERLSRALQ